MTATKGASWGLTVLLSLVLFSAFGQTAAGAKEATAFPTSTEAPKGAPWKTMGRHAFGGNEQDACRLLGLTNGQCREFIRLRDSGGCSVRDIPNDVVLDALTYSTTRGHRVQKRVLVVLERPSTRATRICDLGDGTVVLWFYGCNNYAVVRGQPPQKNPELVTTEKAAGEICTWRPMPEVPIHYDGTIVGFGWYGWSGLGTLLSTPGSTFTSKEWEQICPLSPQTQP